MLSNTEREYLSGKYIPTQSHKRVLNHKIRKKLREFLMLELPLIQNSSVIDFSNVVNEFGNWIVNNDGIGALTRGADAGKTSQLPLEFGNLGTNQTHTKEEKRDRCASIARPDAPQASALSRLCNGPNKRAKPPFNFACAWQPLA